MCQLTRPRGRRYILWTRGRDLRHARLAGRRFACLNGAQASAALEIPMTIPYAGLPVGMGLIIPIVRVPSREVAPFFSAALAMLAVVAFVPAVSLWLPNLLMGKG